MTQSQSLIEEERKTTRPKPAPSTVEVRYFALADQTSPSTELVKQQAASLLCSEGWHTVPIPPPPKLTSSGPSYVYALPQPRRSSISNKPHPLPLPIPEWDDLTELPSLNPPRFSSSDFLSTLRPLPNMWTLIPQPHLLPSPHHIPQLPPACPKEFRLRGRGKISPYSRSAVWIPIAGSVPYAGASPAMISSTWPLPRRVDSLDPSTMQRGGDMVLWTPKSVHRLWHFLVKIQEKGNCGPIGISYQPSHLAAISSVRSSDSEPVKKKKKKANEQEKEDCAYVKVHCPTVLREYLVHALRNFPAGKDEERRKPLMNARFASVEDDGGVYVR